MAWLCCVGWHDWIYLAIPKNCIVIRYCCRDQGKWQYYRGVYGWSDTTRERVMEDRLPL